MIKVSDYIAKRLKEVYNVENFFMVSGGGAMHLNDSLGREIPYICNHHEQACAIAAEGYSKVSNKLAVVNVTTGPGGLNCLNGVFGQWTDSVPVLYISGQVKFSTTIASCPDISLRQLGDQEVDIVSVVEPLTKYAQMMTDPKTIKYHLDRAIYEATTGRFGPVWLDIPMNVQAAIINENDLIDFVPPNTPPLVKEGLANIFIKIGKQNNENSESEGLMSSPSPLAGEESIPCQYNSDCLNDIDNGNQQLYSNHISQSGGKESSICNYEEICEKILQKLNTAKRPVIIAGYGIRLSKQEETFKKIVEKLKIPILTTFRGFDLIEDENPYYIGRIGTIGQRAGNFALQNADFVLCLGTRNNIRQVSYNWENFAKNAFKIVIDIDKAELDKPTVKPDLAVNSDLKTFLPELLNQFEHKEVASRKDWLEWCQIRKEKYSFKNIKEYQPQDENINPYSFVKILTSKLGKNDVLVSANATPSICIFQAGVSNGEKILMNSGDASMGYDLPAAIGACIANERKSTVCVAGDGSIMMNLQELQTIKHNKLPIKIFILNNDGYISIKQTQKNFFKGHMTGAGVESGVSTPDFVEVGKAFGIKSIRISKNTEMNEKIQEVLDANEPVICDVCVKTDYSFAPKLSSRKLPDGTMISASLEDMSPFLDRDEFEQNIIK